MRANPEQPGSKKTVVETGEKAKPETMTSSSAFRINLLSDSDGISGEDTRIAEQAKEFTLLPGVARFPSAWQQLQDTCQGHLSQGIPDSHRRCKHQLLFVDLSQPWLEHKL